MFFADEGAEKGIKAADLQGTIEQDRFQACLVTRNVLDAPPLKLAVFNSPSEPIKECIVAATEERNMILAAIRPYMIEASTIFSDEYSPLGQELEDNFAKCMQLKGKSDRGPFRSDSDDPDEKSCGSNITKERLMAVSRAAKKLDTMRNKEISSIIRDTLRK